MAKAVLSALAYVLYLLEGDEEAMPGCEWARITHFGGLERRLAVDAGARTPDVPEVGLGHAAMLARG